PGFAGKRSQLNLDVGLIKIADVRDFTAQVLGIGELDELVDLHPGNLSLELAGLPVMAHGGASGPMRGEILGFFFRYRSLGGIDHVADLAIGPRDGGELDTRPGDSGTLWFLDLPDEELERRTPRDARAWRRRPIAMQWGGGAFSGATESNGWPVALATSLSTALRELEVDLVRDWANGISEYWGKVGHYKVGAAACTLMRDAKLAKLMKANVERIGVSDERIKNGLLPGESTTAFVALADVPDLVWRATRKKDAANHFADMDEKGFGAFDGKTLMDLWDDGLRTPKDWTRFYDEKEVATGESIADKHRGALPFRVKELYLAMVKAVKAKRLAEFICAAGVLAHYVGDACQPLHVSYLHHGRPGHDEDKVHSIYESTMLDRFAEKVIVGVNAKLGTTKATATVQGGDEAASVVVALMKRTIKKLPPIEVIEAFNAEDGKDRLPHMWTTLGARTIDCLADGSKTLAKLWESAWKEGGGSAIAQDKLVAQTEKSLLDLYLDKKFLEPNWLKDL
ncbi:MAG: hypothetical protein JNM17_33925, partial [Archangium sp.]|nr:hypothetical protein [Archangium sp.]